MRRRDSGRPTLTGLCCSRAVTSKQSNPMKQGEIDEGSGKEGPAGNHRWPGRQYRQHERRHRPAAADAADVSARTHRRPVRSVGRCKAAPRAELMAMQAPARKGGTMLTAEEVAAVSGGRTTQEPAPGLASDE